MPKVHKNKNSVIVPIPCGWRHCTLKCDNDLLLNAHLEDHIEKDLPMDTESCQWNDCDFNTNCVDEMRRHLFYHGYYTGLLVHGNYAIEKDPKLPKCTLDSKTYEFPELKNDFVCEWDDCVLRFHSVVEFQDHIVKHASFEYEMLKSPDDEKPKTQCKWNFCTKILDNRYRLLEHISTHSNRKALACNKCGEIFRTKTTFADHLRRQPENNTQKYQCAQCLKFLSTKKLLRSHVVKHVNCYKCNMCDMTCSSVSSLATHIRYRHLKDKPYECSECSHRCVRESDLAKHIKSVHKKELHHCNQPGCNYVVRSYNLLRRHFLEVHNSSPFIYICHCCDKLFKYGKSLSAHLMKKHDFRLPSGHKRFTYKIDGNGFFRLETTRIESLEAPKRNPDSCDTEPDSSAESSTKIDNNNQISVTNETIGEIIISLPNRS